MVQESKVKIRKDYLAFLKADLGFFDFLKLGNQSLCLIVFVDWCPRAGGGGGGCLGGGHWSWLSRCVTRDCCWSPLTIIATLNMSMLMEGGGGKAKGF